jgi:nucleoside-diphosphate-sugar epimerase
MHSWENFENMKDCLLLAGSTGFLGGAILAELLQNGELPGMDMLLLVRAATPAEGVARVCNSLRRFEVPEEIISRIGVEQIICGGLTTTGSFEQDPRLQNVTRVINCAGITSFGPHPEVWTTNVDGTLAFGHMVAKLPHLRRFIHVSTAMICGSKPPQVVQEEMYPKPKLRHFVPYTESKAEAERRLRVELVDCPLVIVRPTIVVGHTRLGCKPSGSIFWAFRMSDALRMVNAPLTSRIDVVPVDYVAEALLLLVQAEELRHATYHLGSGEAGSCSFQEIDQAFRSAMNRGTDRDFRHVSFQEAAEMQPHFDEMFGPCNKRFMLGAMRLYGSFASLNTTFDNSRALEEGVAKPPRFVDYLARCYDASKDITIAEQAMIDFA